MAKIAYFARLLWAYAKETRSPLQFVRLVQMRTALSRGIGRFVCPRPVTRAIHVRSLGGPVVLRSHTTDISVHDELVVSHTYHRLAAAAPSVASIVDLGANIGLATRWMARVFPAAQILAVEPEPGNARILRMNAAFLPGRVRVEAVAVGDAPGTATIRTDSGEHGFTIVGEAGDGGGVEVPVTTMTALLADTTFDTIDILKCDIEGAERLLFARCDDWIGRVRLLEIECHGPYTLGDLQSDLRRNGADFELLDHEPNPAFGCEVALLRNTAPPT